MVNNCDSLLSISDNESEEFYRAKKCLSYSTIAKYEREGIKGIPDLFKPFSSPSLSFGSAVDCLITDGEEEFNKKYGVSSTIVSPYVAETSQKIFSILKENKKNNPLLPVSFSGSEVPNSVIHQAFIEANKYVNKTPDDHSKLWRNHGGEAYYDELVKLDGKTILDQSTYDDVLKCSDLIWNSPATKPYFGKHEDPEGVERLYQVKMMAELDNVGLGPIKLKCMFDLVCVNHIKKSIILVDLKTSCSSELAKNGGEEGFSKHFLEWNYDIQARLYTRIMKERLKGTKFEDYTIVPSYKYIIVHRDTKNPVVWSFSQNHVIGDIILNNRVLRDPEVIAHELQNYLDFGVPPLKEGQEHDILADFCRK